MRESKVPEPYRLVTAEELERFPSDDRRYKLVEGRLVAMTPVSWQIEDRLRQREVASEWRR